MPILGFGNCNLSGDNLQSSLALRQISLIEGGGGGGGVREGVLPNKGRYGCVASAKPRPGKISLENLMPGQKSARKPNDRASFHKP